jgi:hypothetical protein
VEEVRWFDPEELLVALESSTRPENPFAGGRGLVSDSGNNGGEETLWIPPPYAIAHHLIAAWVAGKQRQKWQREDDGAARL